MKKIPIIIDCDTGTDDAICLAVALRLYSQNLFLDIRAITCVCGNVTVDKTSRNTLDIVTLLESDLSVSIGADKPLKTELVEAISHGRTGLGDIKLDKSPNSFCDMVADELIYQEAVTQKGELEILAIGPLTNVALAIQKHPDIVDLIKRITIMGGAVRGGNMTMASEFNIYNDPDAALIAFHSGIPLTMAGLDVTLKPCLPRSVIEHISKLRNPYASFVDRVLDFMVRRKDEIGGDDPNLHDVIALASIIKPELFVFENYYMTVETQGLVTKGMTVADFNNVEQKPSNVNAAVDIDADGFWSWFTDCLS